MDKNVLARRKAQQLARDGKIPLAVAEMRRLLGEAESDPYDHVYLGDLLVRAGRTAEALDAWMDAVQSYQREGLHRNAIAICRKVLRLDAGRHLVHRVLGDLYYLEGLVGEAVPHFLAYLDGVVEVDRFDDAFLEAVERASSVVGLQHEAALRLAEHYTRAGREDRAAALLRSLAGRLTEHGEAVDIGQELVRKAARAEEAFLARRCAESEAGAVDVGSGAAAGEVADEATPEGVVAASPERTPGRDERLLAALEEPYRAEASTGGFLRAEPGQAGAPTDEAATLGPMALPDVPDPADALPADRGEALDPAGSSEPLEEVESLASAAFAEALSELAAEASRSAVEAGRGEEDGASGRTFGGEASDEAADHTSPPPTAGPRIEPGDFIVEHFPASSWSEESTSRPESSALDQPGVEVSGTSEPSRRSWVERADEAFEAGRWSEARRLLERARHEQPLDPTALTRLVEITRLQEDSAGELHYLVLLGDAWIEAGVMEEALEVFLQVLKIDPEDSTARRRLARFREMGVSGADRIPEETRNSIAGVLETSGATLAVGAPERAVASDEWVDLGALLDEFREGVKKQIAGDDWQSHYDLAVSHQGMGLFDEAIDEADAVLGAPGISPEMEGQARELRGLCLMELQRHREAVHEFRSALEEPVEEGPRRLSLLYHLGVALESVAEWREAAEIFGQIAEEGAPFSDVDERLDHCRTQIVSPEAHDRAA